MLKIFGFIIFALLLTGCNDDEMSIAESHPVIAAYSQSYNDKDLPTMTALMHPDIEWLSVEENQIEVHVSGKEALSASMKEWFETPGLPQGALRGWSVNGNYVAVTETAFWTTDEGVDKSQSALTVYELDENLIRRVYYFPSVEN